MVEGVTISQMGTNGVINFLELFLAFSVVLQLFSDRCKAGDNQGGKVIYGYVSSVVVDAFVSFDSFALMCALNARVRLKSNALWLPLLPNKIVK